MLIYLMERAVGVEPTTASLEGWDSTAELRPRTKPFDRPSYPSNPDRDGGQARIRTLEDISQQIYSLPPLATWVPARHDPYVEKSIFFLGFFFDTGVIKKSKPLRAQLSLLTKRMTADVLGQAKLGNAGFY